MAFVEFITSLLKRSNKKIDKFITPENMKIFETAFTHESAGLGFDYELLELVGDLFVNASIMKYLRQWDPNIVSVKYLTRLKHNISSKKDLALMAEGAGFWKHIRMDKEIRDRFDAMPTELKHDDTEYLSLLEDVFEAFIGAVHDVGESVIVKPVGVGFIYCYEIVKSFLKDIHISLVYTDVFDPKTLYKEVCDKNHWNFKTCMRTEEVKDAEGKRVCFITTCVGFPFGDRIQKRENQEVLAIVRERIKGKAENGASKQAVEVLKNKYGIFNVHSSPYEK